jgi:hypothetical protein
MTTNTAKREISLNHSVLTLTSEDELSPSPYVLVPAQPQAIVASADPRQTDSRRTLLQVGAVARVLVQELQRARTD